MALLTRGGSPFGDPFASCRHDTSLLQACQMHQVVRDHLQTNHHLGTHQANRAQVLAAHLRQSSKRMFAKGALSSNTMIAALLSLADRLLRGAFALDTGPIALHVQLGLSGVLG